MTATRADLDRAHAATLNVTIYCRISLDRAGEMLAVERQESECRAYCARQGWTVREVIVDNDISATSGKVRPGFERLLTSKPEAIVAWHPDRLIRLSRELLRVIDLGVNVYTVNAGHVDLSTPAGRAVAKTITAWSEYEGEQKGIRQVSSHIQRAETGRPWWTKRPFGYERDGTLRAVEAVALQEAYGDFVARRVTLSDIARSWNLAGLTTTMGGAWSQNNVRQVMAPPRNAGICTRYGKEVGAGAWEAVIDVETFRATQAILRAPGRGSGGGGTRKGLLVGVARCGKCGGPVRLTAGSGGARHYKCGAYCTRHPVDAVDKYVGTVTRATLRDSRFVSMVTGDNDAEPLIAERDALAVRMDELGQDYADGLLDRAEFVALRKRQQGKLAALDAKIVTALARTTLGGLPPLRMLADNWDDETRVSVTEKRRAIAAFLTVTLLPRRKGERTYDPAVSLSVERVSTAGD